MSDNTALVLFMLVLCLPAIIYAIRGKKDDGSGG